MFITCVKEYSYSIIHNDCNHLNNNNNVDAPMHACVFSQADQQS